MERYLDKLDKILELHSQAKEPEAFENIKQLRETIIFDIALKNSKSKYEREQLKSAKTLLKNIGDDKPRFKKMYKIGNSFQICDGYVAVVLNKSIKGLELNTADGEYFDCRNVLKTANGNYFENDYNYEKVDIDILELEQLAIKIKKYKEPPYPTEFLKQKFNTYYHPLRLLTAIKILGTENVKVYFHTSNGKDPIYLKSDLGEGIVLPITVSKNEE